MKTIVFQGDSITDANRIRENGWHMGCGYAAMTAGKIGMDYPGQYQFYNRGISGNRSTDMYARIKSDAINLKPDILTILIGVNDVWHEYGHHNGVSAPKYERILEMFICEVKEVLPDVKIFLLEPFVLSGFETEQIIDTMAPEVALRAEASKRVAEKLSLPFIPLQEKISALADQTSSDTVLRDGVHPTCVGHELISRELYSALKAVL